MAESAHVRKTPSLLNRRVGQDTSVLQNNNNNTNNSNNSKRDTVVSFIMDSLHLHPHSEEADAEEARALEAEAYGALDDTYFKTVEQDGAILTRALGNQLVHFMYQEDVDLFEEVVAFKKKHPEMGLVQALGHFLNRENCDVICKVVYSDIDTHWDAIIETPLRDDEEEKERVFMRANFERELLRNRLILVRERGPVEMKVLRTGKATEQKPVKGEELGSHYIKIIISFEQLCKEAERLKLRLEMSNKEQHLFNKISEKFEVKQMGHFRPSEAHRRAIAAHAQAHAIDDAQVVDTEDIAGLVISSGEAAVQEVKNKVIAIRDAVETTEATFISFLQFAFVLVPTPVEVKSHPFDDKLLHEFVGGNGPPEQVQLSFFSTSHRNMITNVVVQRCQVRVPQEPRPVGINDMILQQAYVDYYPIHDGAFADHSQKKHVMIKNDRSWLYFNWARFELSSSKLIPVQPLKQIRDYFGEYVAFYFAWLGFYTVWLIAPALLGLIVFIFSVVKGVTENSTTYFDNVLMIPFSLFMSIWGTLFLRFWGRRSIALSTGWDLRDMDRNEARRPEYYGTKLRKDPITGKVVPFMPSFAVMKLRFTSWLCVLIAIMFMVAFEFLIILLHAQFKRDSIWISTTVSSLLSLVNIVVLTPVYLWIAMRLTRSENHKTHLGFENALLAKGFLMSAIQNYSYLFYVGVFKVFTGNSLQSVGFKNESCRAIYGVPDSCTSELMLSMAITFLGVQTFCQAQAIAQPFVEEWIRMRALSKKLEAGQKIMTRRQAARRIAPQYILDDVLNVWVRRNEFTAKVIEYGFVVLFSLAFPLAPFLALISSVLEVRFAAYRLVVECKRPFAMRAQDIGAWKVVMEAVSFAGILVNAFIIAFSSGYFHDTFLVRYDNDPIAKLGVQLAFILIFEHVVLMITGIVEWTTAVEPKNIRYAVEREKYLNRVANGDIVEVEDEEDEANDTAFHVHSSPSKRSTYVAK
ncbi:hypothetical protein CcCBS67573_g05259 [Chytriomyces confervae]|uniref:Uncharacterized protein n=1 Tax=Chytriomyces confervae TaxID=246404 RepID=A0A507FAW1_9FUNG|nr:hypothetical protein CcCBS67573_g05259 [Chytriomyces confervae]